MTLDDLFSDFTTAFGDGIKYAQHLARHGPGLPDSYIRAVEELVGERPELMVGVTFNDDVIPAYRAAKVYVIARDEGFDAAMLWKLSWDGTLG